MPKAAGKGDRAGKTQLRVGRLVKAHGLKGALKLELYTDDPDGRFVSGATFTLQVPESSPWHGKPLTVREFRWMNSHPVAFFEGVDDRSSAEELVKAILWIDHEITAPVPDEWYDHQLVGLRVLRDGENVGQIIRVEHFPAQDLLVVKTDTADEVLVPLVQAIVPEVDISAGFVVITPPPGLFGETVDADEPEPADTEPADTEFADTESVDPHAAPATGTSDADSDTEESRFPSDKDALS